MHCNVSIYNAYAGFDLIKRRRDYVNELGKDEGDYGSLDGADLKD